MNKLDKTILTIGGATYDIFIHCEDAELSHLHSETISSSKELLCFEQGVKIEISQLHYAAGGGATNSAASFATQGFNTYAFFKIARDQEGRFILDDLKSRGVNTSAVATTEEIQTGTSFIIPAPHGDRTILAHRGANGTILDSDLPHEALKKTDGVYITSLSQESSHTLYLATLHAKNTNALVACNPGKSQLQADATTLKKSLENIDIFILNAHEARVFLHTLCQDGECAKRVLESNLAEISGTCPTLLKDLMSVENVCLDLRHYFREILSRGPKIVVVTNGEEGVYAATQEALYFHKSIPTKVMSTVGAGDSFGSCFFGSLVHDCDIETALTFGSLNSSSVLGTPDAKTGLLSFTELQERKNNLPKNLLTKFNW